MATSVDVQPLECAQDADSDDEWQSLVDATDSNVHKIADILSVVKEKAFVQKLKSRLSSSSAQVLDAVLEGASRLRPVLQIFCNILALKWFVSNHILLLEWHLIECIPLHQGS